MKYFFLSVCFDVCEGFACMCVCAICVLSDSNGQQIASDVLELESNECQESNRGPLEEQQPGLLLPSHLSSPKSLKPLLPGLTDTECELIHTAQSVYFKVRKKLRLAHSWFKCEDNFLSGENVSAYAS